MSWSQLRRLADAPLGRVTILVPFLPFVIDLISRLAQSASGIREGVGEVETVVFGRTVAVSRALLPVIDWLEDNRYVVMLFYIGATLFLVVRVGVAALGPKWPSLGDASDDLAKLAEAEALASRMLEQTMPVIERTGDDAPRHGVSEHLPQLREALREQIARRLDAIAHAERRAQDMEGSRHEARVVLTLAMLASLALLVGPAILKFLATVLQALWFAIAP